VPKLAAARLLRVHTRHHTACRGHAAPENFGSRRGTQASRIAFARADNLQFTFRYWNLQNGAGSERAGAGSAVAIAPWVCGSVYWRATDAAFDIPAISARR
jgi:hypothetical protein